MRCLILCTFFFALTGLVFTSLTGLSPDTAHSAAPDDDVKEIAKELRQLSNQWAKAFTNHDVAFGQRIFADDFAYIMPDGTERNKNAFLKLFRTETAGKTSRFPVSSLTHKRWLRSRARLWVPMWTSSSSCIGS